VDGSCHSSEGFQVSKGDKEKGQKGVQQGEQKSKGIAPYILQPVYVYINALSM
jgi:hypothetical protein